MSATPLQIRLHSGQSSFQGQRDVGKQTRSCSSSIGTSSLVPHELQVGRQRPSLQGTRAPQASSPRPPVLGRPTGHHHTLPHPACTRTGISKTCPLISGFCFLHLELLSSSLCSSIPPSCLHSSYHSPGRRPPTPTPIQIPSVIDFAPDGIFSTFPELPRVRWELPSSQLSPPALNCACISLTPRKLCALAATLRLALCTPRAPTGQREEPLSREAGKWMAEGNRRTRTGLSPAAM